MRPKKVQLSAQNKPLTQTLQEAFARVTPFGKGSRRLKEITAAVTTYVCKDMAPIYTVEKRVFRELVLILDPRYQMQIPFYLLSIMQNVIRNRPLHVVVLYK
jgi:hypothetical protein